MPKTTDIQIEKSCNLIEGLCRHIKEMGERGVSNNEIDETKKLLKGYYPQEQWPDYGIPDKR